MLYLEVNFILENVKIGVKLGYKYKESMCIWVDEKLRIIWIELLKSWIFFERKLF